MTSRIAVTTPDGDVPCYLWLPERGTGPGLLLLQEIFGVSGYIRRRAADLAAEGYVVLAPELYWRLERQGVDESAPDAVEQAMALAALLDPADAIADSVAAFGRLRELDEVTGAAGLVGFCLGGGLAFAVAAQTEPDALVSYYGSALPRLLDLAPRVTCPSLHHFGTADDYLDTDAVREITQAVTVDGGPAQVELYEGANHAFDNDDFFLHHPEASRAAWATTTRFLHEHVPV